jgi:DNA-binding NarL/FixJ family response regulator
MSEASLLVTAVTVIDENKEWLFSGVGIIAASYFVKFLQNKRSTHPQEASHVPPQPGTQPFITVNVENNNESKAHNENESKVEGIIEQAPPSDGVQVTDIPNKTETLVKDENYYKKNTTILIIDDEVQFKLPKIFRDSGWINTKLVPDVNSVNAIEIVEADILFVDVQGVGKELGFKDEGLGLVAAIKTKFPNKKVIIYSVIAEGNRFHEAFNLCDGCLSKDADPYQFECLVEKFTIHRGLYE